MTLRKKLEAMVKTWESSNQYYDNGDIKLQWYDEFLNGEDSGYNSCIKDIKQILLETETQ